jgi:peptide/nickel transport system substrate-binding protein
MALAVATALLALAACGAGRADGDAIVVGMTNSPSTSIPGSAPTRRRRRRISCSTARSCESTTSYASCRRSPSRSSSRIPLTYVARLRRGVAFHDGAELTAADVVYTFRSFLDPDFRGRSGAYRMLGAVDALDPYTVRFTLKEPFGSFPINLVMGIVREGSGAANARDPVGTGPYRLAHFVADDRTRARRLSRLLRRPAP